MALNPVHQPIRVQHFPPHGIDEHQTTCLDLMVQELPDAGKRCWRIVLDICTDQDIGVNDSAPTVRTRHQKSPMWLVKSSSISPFKSVRRRAAR